MAEKINKTKEDILAIYKKGSEERFDYNRAQKEGEQDALDVLGEYAGDIKRGLSEINDMGDRATLYTNVILAKMKILDSMYAPYSLDSLLDLKHDTPAMKERIRNYLYDITQPVGEQEKGESEADYRRRTLPESRKRFNQEFFKPMGDQMTDILQYKYAESAKLDMDGQLKLLAPYELLTEGMYDAYCQKFAQTGKNDSEIHHFHGYQKEDFAKTVSRIDAMRMIQMADHKHQMEDIVLEGAILREPDMQGRWNNTLAAHFQTEFYHENTMKELAEIKQTPAELQETRGNAFKNCNFLIVTSFAPYCLSENGLTAHLSDQERLVLTLDRDLMKRMTLNLPKTMDVAELKLGDMDLQLGTPKDQVDTRKLADLKLVIADSLKKQELVNQTTMKNDDPQSLKKNCAALRAAEDMLSERTHWFNSSENYRNMQDSLKALRRFAETVNESGQRPTHEQQQKMLELTEKAREAAGTYLRGKGAEDGHITFKNDYETKRVSAARTVLSMLENEARNLKERSREAAFREKSEKVMDLLEENVPGFSLTPEEKAAYGSPERLALHDMAKKTMEESEAVSAWAREKNADCEVPIAFNRSLTAYLSTMNNPVIQREKRAILEVMSGKDTLSMHAKEKLFVITENRVSELEADKVDPDKHSMKEVLGYATAHMGDMIAGFDIQNGAKTEIAFNMTLKEGSKDNFRALEQRHQAIGGLGHTLVKAMASDICCVIPFDKMTAAQANLAATALLDNARELGIKASDQKEIMNGLLIRGEIDKLHELGDLKHEPLALEDFNGAVTMKQVKSAYADRLKAMEQVNPDSVRRTEKEVARSGARSSERSYSPRIIQDISLSI